MTKLNVAHNKVNDTVMGLLQAGIEPRDIVAVLLHCGIETALLFVEDDNVDILIDEIGKTLHERAKEMWPTIQVYRAEIEATTEESTDTSARGKDFEMKIPENAVKAAYDHLCKVAGSWQPISKDNIRETLTAAAPYMRYKREFNISSCTVDLSGADYKRFLDGVTGFEVSLDEETRSFGEYNEGDRVFFNAETGDLDAHDLFILSRPAFEKKVQERISALPHMSGVKVKQLEWVDVTIKKHYEHANSPFGQYRIIHYRFNDWRWMLVGDDGAIVKGPANSRKEALAFIQADYEKRFWAMVDVTAVDTAQHSIGWLYHSDDAGTEFSENHPIESGECLDAKDIKPATAENLRDELLISWAAWAEDRGGLNKLRNATSPAREQALDLSVLERLAKIADEYDEPDENGPFPDIQDAMISIRDLRQIRKLLAAILALKSQPAPQVGSK